MKTENLKFMRELIRLNYFLYTVVATASSASRLERLFGVFVNCGGMGNVEEVKQPWLFAP